MYWTLDNRPPTLDEILHQGAERIRAAVEAVCTQYDAPQLEVPKEQESKSDRMRRLLGDDLMDAMSHQILPGHYFEVPGHVSVSDLHSQFRDAAAQQNMYPYGLEQALGGFGQYAGTRASAAAAASQRNAFADLASAVRPALGDRLSTYPLMTEAQHTFQVTKDGTRWLGSRGPFYHPPRAFGTITEFS